MHLHGQDALASVGRSVFLFTLRSKSWSQSVEYQLAACHSGYYSTFACALASVFEAGVSLPGFARRASARKCYLRGFSVVAAVSPANSHVVCRRHVRQSDGLVPWRVCLYSG